MTTTAPHADRLPTPCPCCGAYALPSTAERSALFAVCDVLVVKVLETVGRRIVNGGPRSRRGQWSGRPFHRAHTVWLPDAQMVDRSLDGAWEVVPAMLDLHGCCGVPSAAVVRMLDEYVRDALRRGDDHDPERLRAMFSARLGLDVRAPSGARG